MSFQRMYRRCGPEPHSNVFVKCSFCDKPAVYHWRWTYPDELLCRDCIELFEDDIREAGERMMERHAHQM